MSREFPRTIGACGYLLLVCVLVAAICLAQEPASDTSGTVERAGEASSQAAGSREVPSPMPATEAEVEIGPEASEPITGTTGEAAPVFEGPLAEEASTIQEASPSETTPSSPTPPLSEVEETAELEATPSEAQPAETLETPLVTEKAIPAAKTAQESVQPGAPEIGPRRGRPVVPTKTERQRAKSVRQSLQILSAPDRTGASKADQIAALANLALQARMQLSALQTERAQFEAEWEDLQTRASETSRRQSRVPHLIRQGRLPLIYAEDARARAEESVSDMNELFDRALKRRAELARAGEQYRAEFVEAKRTARAFQEGELRKAWPAALRVLSDRVTAVEEIVSLLDRILAKAVEVSEANAQLALELNRAIRLAAPRSLLARTVAPLGTESLAEMVSEVAAVRLVLHKAASDAHEAIMHPNSWISSVISVFAAVLAALLWYQVGRVPSRLASGNDGDTEVSSRLMRGARLLVPAARAVALVALWAVVTRVWGLPEGWWIAGGTILGAWAAFFIFDYALRELLAPSQPEFRVVNLRQEAAQNSYRILRTLAAFTALLLPPIALLGAIESRPSECIRALQVIYGAGLVLIGVYLTRRAGGLRAVLPRPETPEKTALQQAGQFVVPLCTTGVLGAVVAAAGGYSNLSTYLSRSLSLEILLLMAAVFIDNLLLRPAPGESSPRWRIYGRWVLWGGVVAAQVPIWRLHAYHATYAFDFLKRSIITVEGAEVTGLSITKGLAVVLIAYLIGRFVRSHLQGWQYLKQRFQAGVSYAVSNLAFYLILAAGVVWGILVSGFQLSVLAVFAGMAGIGLGFGLQDVVKNFVSGLILLLERPVAVGDFVEVGDLQGHITAINLRSTTIRTRDNNVVLVPNSDLASSIVTNLTISDPRVRVTVNVGVSYNSDLALVRSIIEDIARSNERVLNDPEPRVHLMDFGSSSVDFALWAWVANADEAILAGPELRMQIWDAFQQHGIEIPFPQTDLHIRSSNIPLPYSGPGSARADDSSPPAD